MGWLRAHGGWVRNAIAFLALAVPTVAVADNRGWDSLIAKLTADGVPSSRVRRALLDPRVPRFTELSFNIEPREPSSMYRRFRTDRDISAARSCRERYADEFRAAERRYGVPASVVSAILHVETFCGRNTGKHIVLHRLARLAMANDPDNVRVNIARHTRGLGPGESESVARRVRARALALEKLFYPEVLAVFRVADQVGIDPLAMRGSPSGAFGFPQFLPTSFLRFAVDGNGDRDVSLYQPADAIASTANYLRSHGWKSALDRQRQRQVIWAYNRSDAYIDTVLFLAGRIERTHPSRPLLADSETNRSSR